MAARSGPLTVQIWRCISIIAADSGRGDTSVAKRVTDVQREDHIVGTVRGDVCAETGRGDSFAGTVRGDLGAGTVRGDLCAGTVRGDLCAETGRGDSCAGTERGDLCAGTGRGDLCAGTIRGDLCAGTVRGDLCAGTVRGYLCAGTERDDLCAGTVRGDLCAGTVRGDLCAGTVRGDFSETGQNDSCADTVRSDFRTENERRSETARSEARCSDRWVSTKRVAFRRHRDTGITHMDAHILVLLCLLPATLAIGARPGYQAQTETMPDANDNVSAVANIITAYGSPSNAHSPPTLAKSEETMTSPAGWSSCPPFCICDVTTQTVSCYDKEINLASMPRDVRHLNLSKCAKNPPNQNEPDANTSSSKINTPDSKTLQPGTNQATTLFTGLVNFTNLQTLDLSCNNLVDVNFASLPANITRLYLNGNAISSLNLRSLQSVLPKLELLDLSGNHLEVLSATRRSESNALFYNRDYLQDNAAKTEKTYGSITTLALSGNEINGIDSDFLASFPSLSYLDLMANKIDILQRHLFANCSKLTYLNLAENTISNLPSYSFKDLLNLRDLILAGLQVTSLHGNTFVGLENLRLLNLSNNHMLRTIHADTFKSLGNLHTLDLTNGNLETIHKPTLDNIRCEVKLAGNHWRCDCNLQHLLSDWNTTLLTDNPTCIEPPHWSGYPVLAILNNDTCTGASIINAERAVVYRLGSTAVLDCIARGDPTPTVTWVTPSNHVFQYKPGYANYEQLHPSETEHRSDHAWHDGSQNTKSANSKRLHLLPNGSLYIVHVARSDTGSYRCIVGNQYGNDTAAVELTLDYTSLFDTVLWTQVVGLCAAASFLVFGILLGIIRNITSWFKIKHQEDANRKFRGMLHSISDYKAAQIDRLSAYKAAKIGKLSAFKNSKMDKFHSLSRPSLGSALHHMQSMREHYSAQIDVIKENCAQKAEHLRENYTLRLQRFRDYKSDKVGKLRGYKAEKIETLRENYTHQAQKIREYGSQQMAKLRSSYKLQQHYLLKLYELLDIANCMTVIEAECIRTESMLFDEDFMNLDLETHPVHIHINLSDSDNDSYYVTASSQSDVSLSVFPQEGATRDESLGESVSDDLGQEEINFNDLKIQPYPSYLNFLESIELETQKNAKTANEQKPRKLKKSKKLPKEQKEVKNVNPRESSRKTNPKSAHRRAKTKAQASQGTDTDSEDNSAITRLETERTLRKIKSRAKQAQKPVQIDLQKRKSKTECAGDGLLSPVTRVDFLRADDDAQSSIYESAHASREQSPNLPMKTVQFVTPHNQDKKDGGRIISNSRSVATTEQCGGSNEQNQDPAYDINCDYRPPPSDNGLGSGGLYKRVGSPSSKNGLQSTTMNRGTYESKPTHDLRHETTV